MPGTTDLPEPAEQIGALSALQLNWEQRDGNIVVTPNDQDRFVVKVGKAIDILRQYQHHKQFESQFSVLVNRLAAWLEEYSDSWDRAFLTAGESTLRFIIVRKQIKFQADITDALSDLGAEIANDPDLDLIKLSARALPLASNESIQSFLDASFTIEFNGDRTRAHRAGKQES